MTAIAFTLISYIFLFLLIVGVIQLLKWRGVFNDSHQPVFDRLVTELALPAIVFGLVTTTTFENGWILPILIITGAVIVSMLIAWGVSTALKFSPAVTGTVVILSAWGSTYTLGTPVLGAVFGVASSEAALGNVLGSFGFALPFFTIGILVAGYFGLKERSEKFVLFPFLKEYLWSPVFLAFWLGLVVAVLFTVFQVPGAGLYTDFFQDFFVVIQHALNLLVWIAVGLLLRPVQIRTLLPPLVIVVAVHLCLLPALVFLLGYAAVLPAMQLEVSVILAAMPSGAIAGVIAQRYGCDGKLAAAILIATYLISLVTLPLIATLVI